MTPKQVLRIHAEAKEFSKMPPDRISIRERRHHKAVIKLCEGYADHLAYNLDGTQEDNLNWLTALIDML